MDKPRRAGHVERKKGSTVGHWIDRLVADAVSDYNASGTYEERKERRSRVLAVGVSRRAHSWCVDLKGSAGTLMEAGCPAEWFADGAECKEVRVRDRRIEIFRGFGTTEVSIRYSEAEREQIEG